MKIRRINESEEDIFVIGTQELTDAGFDGDFNELRDEFENRDAVVIGSYDEDGNPTMTITKIDSDEVESVLSDFGIDDPSEFTQDVDTNDDFDFNKTIDGDDIEETDNTDPEDDDFITVNGADGDEEVDVIDDTEGGSDNIPGDEDAEIDVIDDETNESLNLRDFFAANRQKGGAVGVLTESATRHILSKVKKIGSKTRETYQAIMEGFRTRQANKVNEERIHNQIMGILVEGAAGMVNPKAAKSPHANVKINGKKLSETSDLLLETMTADATKEFAVLSGEYLKVKKEKNRKAMKSLTESIRNQSDLLNILFEEKTFRKGTLNEDAIDNAPAQTSDPNNQTAPTGDTSQQPADGGSENELSNQEAELTAVVFTVKNADEFIKVLTDNGIPAKVLEKVEDASAEDNDGSDNGEGDAQNQPDANMGGAPAPAPTPDAGGGMGAPAPAANPFESHKPKGNPQHLNEDAVNPFADETEGGEGGGDNPFAEDVQPSDTPTDDNTADEEPVGGEKVRLKDASFVTKVREILANVYKYGTEKFDDKIGGQIIDDNSTPDDGSEDDSSEDDDNGGGTDDYNEKDGVVDDLNPLDVFGDI